MNTEEEGPYPDVLLLRGYRLAFESLKGDTRIRTVLLPALCAFSELEIRALSKMLRQNTTIASLIFARSTYGMKDSCKKYSRSLLFLVNAIKYGNVALNQIVGTAEHRCGDGCNDSMLMQLLDRNREIAKQVRSIVYLLIGIRNSSSSSSRDGMGSLGLLPKELVKMIARMVWAERKSPDWIPR